MKVVAHMLGRICSTSSSTCHAALATYTGTNSPRPHLCNARASHLDLQDPYGYSSIGLCCTQISNFYSRQIKKHRNEAHSLALRGDLQIAGELQPEPPHETVNNHFLPVRPNPDSRSQAQILGGPTQKSSETPKP